MFNALWFNAQELNGTGQLYRVISLAAAASTNIRVTTTPALGLRIGLAAPGVTGSASSSLSTMYPKRSMAASPTTGALAYSGNYMAPRRSMAVASTVATSSFLGTSFRRNMAATVGTNVTGYFNSFTKFAAAVSTNVHPQAAPALTRTLTFAAARSTAVTQVMTPPTLKRFFAMTAKVSTVQTATPDVKVGGSTWWRLLAALPTPGAKATVTISPNSNFAAKVGAGVSPKFATLSRTQELFPAHIFSTVFQNAVMGGRSNLYASAASARATQVSSVYRTTLAYAAASTGATQRAPVLRYNVFLGAAASTNIAMKFMPTLSFNIGMASKSKTATSGAATANLAWKFFAYASPSALPVAPAIKLATKLQVPASPVVVTPQVNASASLTVKPSIILGASATVTTAPNAAGYFTSRRLVAAATCRASQNVTITRLVKLASAASGGASAAATVYRNLFDLEPDWRTFVLDQEDWTDTVDQDDWTFTLTDDVSMKTFYKQPSDILGYDIDFTTWFAQIPDDYIASATCAITAASSGPTSALTIQRVVLINDTSGVARIAKVWLAAGTSGVTYSLQLLMTSANGRVKDVDFQMVVQEQ